MSKAVLSLALTALALALAMGCEESTPEPARPPRALMVPAWVEQVGPASPSPMMLPSENTVALRSDPGVPMGGARPRSPARGEEDDKPRSSRSPSTAASSTFFPKEWNAPMFGGCSANDYTGGKCPDSQH
jgi:hypothetical protein